MTTRQRLAKNCGLIGAGMSLALYAVFGLLQGMVLGGTAGMMLANAVFGAGAIEITGADLVTRVIMGGAMLAGALIALIMFLVAGSVAGYVIGRVLGVSVREREAEAQHKAV